MRGDGCEASWPASLKEELAPEGAKGTLTKMQVNCKRSESTKSWKLGGKVEVNDKD